MAGERGFGFDGLDKLPTPPRYRAILLGKSGEVLGMTRLQVSDDPTAIVEAKALINGHAVELWDGVRFIEHFPVAD